MHVSFNILIPKEKKKRLNWTGPLPSPMYENKGNKDRMREARKVAIAGLSPGK